MKGISQSYFAKETNMLRGLLETFISYRLKATLEVLICWHFQPALLEGREKQILTA